MADQRSNRRELLDWINEVSFAVNDVILFLDTHPDNMEALEYFEEYKKKREDALREYADNYGPLTLDSACTDANCWSWIHEPWPWQKGGC
jgi:spore coat protein JB